MRERSRRSSLLQPRLRCASLACLLLHGLQGRRRGVDLLFGLPEGLRLLQHIVPLPSHRALLSGTDSSKLGEEVAPLHLRLLHPLPCRSHAPLPVGGVVPCLIEHNLALFWRRSVPGLQLLQCLLQRIELLFYRQQRLSQFSQLSPLPHKFRGGLHPPYAAELLKIGLTLLARRGNLLFECGNL